MLVPGGRCYIESTPMGYRDAPRRPRCARCRELAAGSCLRCERPLCTEHLPEASSLCDTCEAEFRTANRPRTRSASLLTVLLAAAAAVLFLLALLAARALPIVWLDRWLLGAAWATGLAAYAMVVQLHELVLALLDRRRRERFVVASPARRRLHRAAGDEAPLPD